MRRRRWGAVIAVIVAVTALVGCSEDDEAGGGDDVDLTGAWVLATGMVDGADIPLIDDHPITLGIAGAAVQGTAACNGYTGTVDVGGDTIRITDLTYTEAACAPPEVMEAEALYLEGLGRVERADRQGETLTLTGVDVTLDFSATSAVATDLPTPP